MFDDIGLNPMASVNVLVPLIRKAIKDFRDNGDYCLMLQVSGGGLRAPRIFDAKDKAVIKTELTEFLMAWGKTKFTGQLALYLKHAEFTGYFDAYPGTGTLAGQQKEGVKYQVQPYKKYAANDFFDYRIQQIGTISANTDSKS